MILGYYSTAIRPNQGLIVYLLDSPLDYLLVTNSRSPRRRVCAL